jgi:hypothetical protein
MTTRVMVMHSDVMMLDVKKPHARACNGQVLTMHLTISDTNSGPNSATSEPATAAAAAAAICLMQCGRAQTKAADLAAYAAWLKHSMHSGLSDSV